LVIVAMVVFVFDWKSPTFFFMAGCTVESMCHLFICHMLKLFFQCINCVTHWLIWCFQCYTVSSKKLFCSICGRWTCAEPCCSWNVFFFTILYNSMSINKTLTSFYQPENLF
jgi:hypothetical protein